MDQAVSDLDYEDLVGKIRDGDLEARERLINDTRHLLLPTATSILKDADGAEDAVQEMWLVVLDKLDQLRDPSRFIPWARKVLWRICIRMIKKRRREQSMLDLAEESDVSGDISDGCLELLLPQIQSCVDQLPARDRALFNLYYNDGRTVREVGQVVDMNKGNVSRNLQRIRGQIKREFERCDDPMVIECLDHLFPSQST